MYNVDDAVARVDSYVVSVTGGGPFVGQRRLVRIDEVGRSVATASLLDGQPAADPAAPGSGAEEADGNGGGTGSSVESPSSSGRRRGRRGGRRRSRARSGNGEKDDG
jgi:ribonuclease G